MRTARTEVGNADDLGLLGLGQGFLLLPLDLAYSISLGTFQIGLGFLLFTLGAWHLPAVELTL